MPQLYSLGGRLVSKEEYEKARGIVKVVPKVEDKKEEVAPVVEEVKVAKKRGRKSKKK